MASDDTLELLRRFESRNVTFIDPRGGWPIVWKRARGVHVEDKSGRRYLDFTAAFGVAAAGHSNRNVAKAAKAQIDELLHAMGDVHPHRRKAELARQLSRLTFKRWGLGEGKTIFANSGFEAVEAALKTAILATGKPGILVFEGAYHGLGYGALNATHRMDFKAPFVSQLREFGRHVPFPQREDELEPVLDQARAAVRSGQVGAILTEPIQARGGIRVPPPGFLKGLRRIADEFKIPLIFDEIYTGFGRTGEWFACEHELMAPDLVCLGKALTGGFPLSACVGRAELMDSAWPPATGEAIHTSTFLGHPVGCAMALAQIAEITDRDLVRSSKEKGEFLLALLRASLKPPANLRCEIRGRGLMAGVEFWNQDGSPATTSVLRIIKELLARGFVFLPEGEHANVFSFTPPLTISRRQLATGVEALNAELARL